MRLRFLVLGIAYLAFARSAQAGRFEIGPRLGVFVPTGDAGDMFDSGIDAGVIATYWYKSTAGLGLDLGFHQSPGSQQANAAADRFFSGVSGSPITGSKWFLREFQITPHVKVALPVIGPAMPWARFGVSLFGVDADLNVPEDQLQAAGWQVVVHDKDKLDWDYGFVGGVGFDLGVRAGLRLGLDGSYHYSPAQTFNKAFTALTIGAHVLFTP